MWRKWLVGWLIVLVLWTTGFSVFLWWNFGGGSSLLLARRSGGGGDEPLIRSGQDKILKASEWASDMVRKYPHESGSFSGVVSSPVSGEIWVIGRWIANPKIIPVEYRGVENDYGSFYAKFPRSVSFTTQIGDDLTTGKYQVMKLADVAPGDYVAVRMTFRDNFGQAIEVRKLIRIE